MHTRYVNTPRPWASGDLDLHPTMADVWADTRTKARHMLAVRLGEPFIVEDRAVSPLCFDLSLRYGFNTWAST